MRYEVEYFGVLGQAEMTLAPKESKTELIVISTARDTVDKAFHQLKILSVKELFKTSIDSSLFISINGQAF